ncbi:hypothetical protein RclHR1_14300004 [Rhizophagus clarus]|uniref:Uncharacterized protein n=1 Tax=Rhizophagus clarus TaxID=94130 RepID=A0A2Z6QGN9_9GLOM|nr:hypothetical protein RclHR1_14300004 [Rhizophagus clarus]
MFNLKDAAKCLYDNDEDFVNSDINEDISNNEGNSENELDNSEDVEMESNYNIEELIQQYSLDDKLVEDTL